MWRKFLTDHMDTLGVLLAFAAFGSGFMAWATAKKTAISFVRFVMIVVAGQVTGCIAMSVSIGYLGWSPFLAPLIGVPCGLVGFFLLLSTIKVGEVVEQRGEDLGNYGVDTIIKRKTEGAAKPTREEKSS